MGLMYTYTTTPKNTRPAINGVANNDYSYVYGRAQPIKHWRKQLHAPNTNNCIKKNEVFNSPICDGVVVGNRCVGGPIHITRSATTNLNTKYYSSNSQYLRSRNKTHAQNQVLGEKITDTLYNSTTLLDSTECTNTKIIYKPNNLRFKTQGSVPASLKILKVRNDSITKNSNSFRSPYGLSGSNFGNYNAGGAYFMKNKINVCNNCKYLGYVKPHQTMGM